MSAQTPKNPAAPAQEAIQDATPREHGFGSNYWRSLEEQFNGPATEDVRREFPDGADLPPSGIDRRNFIQLAGASMALAGATGCISRPNEKLVPYTRAPVGLVPGVPQHYATASVYPDGTASGLLVRAWEGRPTKVEGNPDHPVNLGASTSADQALLLQLYDPDRAKLIRNEGKAVGYEAFARAMKEKADELARDGGSKLRFLTAPDSSPLNAEIREQLTARFPRSRTYTWSPTSDENVYEGARIAFGRPLATHYDLRSADVVVSLDADFLDATPETQPMIRAFADRRVPENGELNRLYAVEARYSVTGASADHRLRLRSAQVLSFALGILAQLGGSRVPVRGGPDALGQEHLKFAKAVADDLRRTRGRSVVMAGHRQPPVVHALAHAINSTLGNIGQTVRFTEPAISDVRSGAAGLRALAEEIRAGQVDTLVITAYNPAYTAPADLTFGALLEQVPNVVYRGLYEDETAPLAAWFLPATHTLESWGDARSPDGMVTLLQPLIEPLYESAVHETDLYTSLLEGRQKPARVLLQESWTRKGASGESWETLLGRGFVNGTRAPLVTPSLQQSQVDAALRTATSAKSAGGLELNFVTNSNILDGRLANSPWMQELPDPMTKVTWDNPALLSSRTAGALELKTGDVAKLEYRGVALEVPVLVLPGHADDAITLCLGYGRTSPAETVANGVGFNAYTLRHAEGLWFDGGAQLTKTHHTHELAITQGHWSMEGRQLAMEQDLEAYQADPGHLTEHHRGDLPSLIPQEVDPPTGRDRYKWGMAIDLSRCTGCNACVAACQAENNIPVVGKKQVRMGREMHWLRIDRYFTGEADDARVINQPVACVHCEKAPCEYVCPVNATVHSDEGLNEMVYNRCVGTRYCANNCPYKVRRFNYFHYNADLSPTQKMSKNPDVTVRARGVIEKCSYCVQRIERTRIDARVEKRLIRDGEIQTACQQACTSGAIVFGTLSDPDSQVSKHHRSPRRYDLLHHLGTRPRTGYLTKIRNPNPELA